MSRTEKLKTAATLVEEVMNTLNTEVQTCEHCNFKASINRNEWQAHLELGALAKKLNRMATYHLFEQE